MIKKKLVYVGHEYHKKTKSIDFLIDVLAKNYEIDFLTYDTEKNDLIGDEEIFHKKFEVLVLFQMPVAVELLKQKLSFNHGIYVPMYDGTGEAPNCFWLDYINFNIINFSYTLHQRLLKMGFSSYYIQFFPKPSEKLEWGDSKSIFFWQRRSNINLNTVRNLILSEKIVNIHIHKAMDPGQEYIEPSDELKEKCNITFSEWYADKEDMLNDVKKAAIYIAPREYEGIGMSFLEAMAMGKCVVAPNHPTMNEYIEHGVTGYLYDIYDKNTKIKLTDIKEIQKNTYLYIQKGYERWEKEKNKILDWVEKDVKINPQLMEKTYKEQFILKKRYVCKKFLLMTTEIGGIYRLFGKVKIPNKLILILKHVMKNNR